MALLRRLLEKQGLEPGGYGLFFVTGEGTFLSMKAPGGPIEEISGYVVDKTGRISSFWLGWDEQLGAPALVEWEPVEPEPNWAGESEYQRARQDAGLFG